MKKFVLTIAVVFGVIVISNAQDLKSKKGVPILPEAGDYAIGIDAAPFLTYFGGFLSNAGATAPTWNYFNGTQKTIMGKYYTDATTAYRAEIRLGVLGSTTKRNMVTDRANSTTPTYPNMNAKKENTWKNSNTNIGLGVGMEKHRGKGLLQGYYGAGLGIYYSNSKDKFEYGNALAPTGTPAVFVSTTEDAFTGASNITTDTYSGNARITERKNGSALTIDLGAFVGAEYFILPKISLGGEFGWGLGLTKNGKTSTTYESTGGAPLTVGTQTIEGAKGGKTSLDNMCTGKIYLMFHF
jgi:hypothetical protein